MSEEKKIKSKLTLRDVLIILCQIIIGFGIGLYVNVSYFTGSIDSQANDYVWEHCNNPNFVLKDPYDIKHIYRREWLGEMHFHNYSGNVYDDTTMFIDRDGDG